MPFTLHQKWNLNDAPETPICTFHSITSRVGYLRLHGNCYNLSSPESPALLLRKQTALQQAFHATLDFSPSKKGYEAGIVVFWSSYSYGSIGIRLNAAGDKRVIIVRTPDEKTVGLLHESEFELSTLAGSIGIQLLIGWKENGYLLSIVAGDQVQDCGFASGQLLTRSPPIGNCFSGMMFGVYAFGNWEPCLDPADFTEIKMVDFSSGRLSQSK